MTANWQFLPTDIVQAEKRKQRAAAWAQHQRSILASDWAQRKMAEMDQMDVAIEEPAPPPIMPAEPPQVRLQH